MWRIILLFALLGKTLTLDYPGTDSRPILSSEEASEYTLEKYLNGWEPEDIVIPDKPDYVVTSGDSIQAVVDTAIINGSDKRIFILIEPGHYMQTVYINTTLPLTIYGGGNGAEDVVIMVTMSAANSSQQYQGVVNSNGTYHEGTSAWYMYQYCANKTSIIDTECTAAVWIESDNFQLTGVTVQNGASDAQAVAIRVEGDKVLLVNNTFKSYQDTIGLGIDSRALNQDQRVLVGECYIEGQIDYVFGGARAVFSQVTFNTSYLKPEHNPIIFAPDTRPSTSYGFLVVDSIVTGSETLRQSQKMSLARSWDRNVTAADLYVPGQSPNGQLVIRDSFIDNGIKISSPYHKAATSGRVFSTNITVDRNLDDNSHNRLWEYSNSGV